MKTLTYHIPVYMRENDSDHVSKRIDCIRKIDEATQHYEGYNVDIHLYTNSKQITPVLDTCKNIRKITKFDFTQEHPNNLTWKTRDAMLKCDADVYVYGEDDHLIMPETLKYWEEHTPIAQKYGYTLGFVQTEMFDDGLFLCGGIPLARDCYRQGKPQAANHCSEFVVNRIELDGKDYMAMPTTYSAMWLCNKKDFVEWSKTTHYTNPRATFPSHNVKPNVAAGPRFLNKKQILPYPSHSGCYVEHLDPNSNYRGKMSGKYTHKTRIETLDEFLIDQ